MDYIKAWAISLSLCSIASVIIYFLVPKGSFEKPMRTIISIFLLSVILSPLFKLKELNFNEIEFLNKDDFSLEVSNQAEEIAKKAEAEFSKILKNALISSLKEEDCKIEDMDIKTNKNYMEEIYVEDIIIFIKKEEVSKKSKIVNIIENETKIIPIFEILD